MGKKLFLTCAVAMIFIFCLTACDLLNNNGNNGMDNTDDREERPEEGNIYEKLTEMQSMSYSTVDIKITTQTKGYSLTSTYKVKNGEVSTMEYSVEQLNSFEISEGVINIPDSYKSTCSGTSKVKDGKIIEQKGDNVDMALEAITATHFRFKEANFSDVEKKDGIFSAKVSNVRNFYGTSDFSGSNMTVTVKYGEAIEKIDLSYTSEENSNVSVTYEFSK